MKRYEEIGLAKIVETAYGCGASDYTTEYDDDRCEGCWLYEVLCKNQKDPMTMPEFFNMIADYYEQEVGEHA